MAKHNAKWTPDVEDGPSTAPKTRDNLVQANRARRQTEPAAAPQETDSESGSPLAVALTPPRTEPFRTDAVHTAETGQHDVRAGPGDAGASDSPMHSTKPAPGHNDSWRRVIAIVAVVFIVGVVASIVLVA